MLQLYFYSKNRYASILLLLIPCDLNVVIYYEIIRVLFYGTNLPSSLHWFRSWRHLYLWSLSCLLVKVPKVMLMTWLDMRIVVVVFGGAFKNLKTGIGKVHPYFYEIFFKFYLLKLLFSNIFLWILLTLCWNSYFRYFNISICFFFVHEYKYKCVWKTNKTGFRWWKRCIKNS